MQETLSALAEPTRLQIVELLRAKPRAVGEIVERLGLRQPQVSKHLRVLSEAGLVEVRPVAQQRIYSPRGEPVHEVNGWLERYRRVREDPFGRRDENLRDPERKGVKQTGNKKQRPT